MVLHDVAVGAGGGVVLKVRCALGVREGKRTNPRGHADHGADDGSGDEGVAAGQRLFGLGHGFNVLYGAGAMRTARSESSMADEGGNDKSDGPVFGTFRVPRSVYYGVWEPQRAVEEPPGLLLAFHGYGQSANSFLQPLKPARDRNLLVVAPQAPNQFYWQQGTSAVGFTWLTRYQRENSLEDNRAYLAELIRVLSETYAFDRNRVFALGFSQGVAMAFRFAESGVVPLAGLAAVCGDLPKDVEEQLDSVERFPVLVMHGKEDPVVPPKKSEDAATALESHGFAVETDFFDGGHELPEAKIARILDWMSGTPAEKRI